MCLRSDLCPPLLKFDAATWRCVAFAERVATAEMYFQASKELLSVWKKTLARRRALPDRPTFAKQDEDWCWQALLTSTERLLVNEIRNENLKEIADIEAQMKSLDPFDPERQEYEKHNCWQTPMACQCFLRAKGSSPSAQIIVC